MRYRLPVHHLGKASEVGESWLSVKTSNHNPRNCILARFGRLTSVQVDLISHVLELDRILQAFGKSEPF